MSKTVDELREAYSTAYQTKLDSYDYDEAALNCIAEAERAGIAAVIRALRDEIIPERMRLTRANDTCTRSSLRRYFNQILGSDAGSEKVAGGSTREDGRAAQPGSTTPATPKDEEHFGVTVGREFPATDPAPAVCVWTHKESWIGEGVSGEAGCDGARRFRRRKRNCPSCGKPIKFTEAKT